MANVITVTKQLFFQPSPSKLENIGVESILEVIPYTDGNYPLINTAIRVTNDVEDKIYVYETVAQVLALIAGGISPIGDGLLIDNDGNFLITNDGDFLLAQA